MLRKLFVLFLIPLLAACGSEEDFSIKVDRSAAIVSQELAKLDPNVLTSAAGLSMTTTERLDDGTVLITMPSASGNGELRFAVVELSPQQSEVKVTLDIPSVTRDTGDGETYEFLSEPDIEKALLEAMGKWKLDVEATRPTENSLAELSEMISTVAIGLQDFEQFEQLAGIAMFQRQESDLGSEAPEDTSAETASDWGSENGGWADEETADDGADSESSADEGGWGAET